MFSLMLSSLIFFPEKNYYDSPKNYGLSEEEAFFNTQDGITLSGWYFPVAESKATLLFFHGNAGNMSGRLIKAKGWTDKGISVFLMDYRGYGKSSGKIEKAKDLVEDARSALQWLESEKKIFAEKVILYGESIGSYPAIELAREKKFAGLVLEAPLTNLMDLAKRHYSWVPEFVLKDFQMKNDEAIEKVKAPVFVLHGNQDEICPVEMGERLYYLAPAPKEFYAVQGGGHNDLPEVAGASYFENPYQFLAKENSFR